MLKPGTKWKVRRAPNSVATEQTMSKEQQEAKALLAADQLLRIQLEQNCQTCKEIRHNHNFGPTHFGSRRCESGSLASGGNIAHCTCDVCF